ncbi:MAG: hypothetical protein QNK23_15195 [Crocinitomicaceae bacterium]|nr:hypothetical protein [Crocinitomicaceae bacterium]
MKSFKSLIVLGLFGMIILVSSSSCKKCQPGDDVNIGIIDVVGDHEVIIYRNIGLPPTPYYITGSHPSADGFQVSFDGGVTKQAINYNQYQLIGNPMTIHCEAAFDRTVTKNSLSNTINYHVVARTCSECEGEYVVDNWALINAVSGYTLIVTNEEIVE